MYFTNTFKQMVYDMQHQAHKLGEHNKLKVRHSFIVIGVVAFVIHVKVKYQDT